MIDTLKNILSEIQKEFNCSYKEAQMILCAQYRNRHLVEKVKITLPEKHSEQRGMHWYYSDVSKWLSDYNVEIVNRRN